MTKKRRGNPRIRKIGTKTRFRPGQTGNPADRSKSAALTEMLFAIGNEIGPKTGKFFWITAESVLRKAFRGDVGAFREIADRGQAAVTTGALSARQLTDPDRHDIEDLDRRIEELLRRAGYRAAAAQTAAGK